MYKLEKNKLERGCPNGIKTPARTFVTSYDFFRFKSQ